MTKHSKALKRRGRTLSPPLSMRSYKLQSILDCNILLERIINAVLQGKLDPLTATKVAYMLSVLHRGIELGKDIEESTESPKALIIRYECDKCRESHEN